jgi:prolyl-tRNA synthetase
MRTTSLWLSTIKETPSDAELISHQLMLRAGLIRKLASGLYTWLPVGLRVLRKVETIVREEMNKIGAQELLMPAVQPAELWQETQRWEQFGPELLKIVDRHKRSFCFGPTHEEVVTDLVRREVKSYKQLPLTVYQIQTKFRDEIRPRFGIMRAREFLMKDAYSFDKDKAGLQKTYEAMYAAYTQIFTRIGLEFRVVLADTGSIGGNASHEFHVLAATGEDQIVFSDESDYAANIELAESLAPEAVKSGSHMLMQSFSTPNLRAVESLKQLDIAPETVVKALIVKGSMSPLVALLLRGDHEINPIKVQKIPEVAYPLTFANEQEIQTHIGCEPGFIGPIGLELPIIADREVMQLTDFVCGANQNGQHLKGVNWDRDLPRPIVADLRKVVAGDFSPDGKGKLCIARGIEVGHVFQLGNKYSRAMNALFVDEKGEMSPMEMGCYGIGVSRIVAAAIEQNHDQRGIVWPDAIAPFQIALVGIHKQLPEEVNQVCEKLYSELSAAGFDVLWDDRDERPGVMFADIDLIGIPHRLVVSEKNLDANVVEYKSRKAQETQLIPLNEVMAFLKDLKEMLNGF